MSFFSRLEVRSKQIETLLCIGLDPHPEDLEISQNDDIYNVLLSYCQRLVESTLDVAVAYKPNIAFYEAYGASGLHALKDVIAFIPNEIPVILDAKRGDIASTANAYAQAVFKALNADALTVNPFLGYDALEPFLGDRERGVFVLCKTSNPSAHQIQDLTVGSGQYLFEIVARFATEWNKNDNVGLIVGATQPKALMRVRSIAPDMWILAPGVGAQSADLSTALRCGLRDDGLGLLLPVSRGIARADDPRKAALTLRDTINQQRSGIQVRKPQKIIAMSDPKKKIADELLEIGCVKFGKFELKSGLQSPIYIDLRILVGFPRLLKKIASAYLILLNDLKFDRLAALPYAALPIATAVSLLGEHPYIYPRKEIKPYGTKAEIEGVYSPGERVVVLDDLITTGGSKIEAIEKLNSEGLVVNDIVVLIDRRSEPLRDFSESGFRLHSVFTLTELLDYFELTEQVTKHEIQDARNFLNG